MLHLKKTRKKEHKTDLKKKKLKKEKTQNPRLIETSKI